MVTPGHDQYDCPSQCQHQGRAARRNLNFKAPWNVRKSHASLIARAARLLSPDFRRLIMAIPKDEKFKERVMRRIVWRCWQSKKTRNRAPFNAKRRPNG